MSELLSPEDLPSDFWYPASFIRVVELGLTNLEPWHVLMGLQLGERARGLAERYPSRQLIPFASRQDNDDVACWEPALGNDVVVIVHDYASSGWENRETYPDFFAWLRQAVEDMIDFE